MPPAIRTLWLGRSVAVWLNRATTALPVGTMLPSPGTGEINAVFPKNTQNGRTSKKEIATLFRRLTQHLRQALAIIPHQPLGNASRLFSAFSFNGRVILCFYSVRFNISDGLQNKMSTNAAAHAHRRHKPHFIHAVVHAHAHSLPDSHGGLHEVREQR